MILSRGDPSIFLERPIALGFLVASVVFLAVMLMPFIRRGRQEVF